MSSRWACVIQQHHFDTQRRHSGCFTALPQVSRRPQRQDQGSKGPSWCRQEPPGLYDISEPYCTSDAGATAKHSARTQPRCGEGGQPFWTHSTARGDPLMWWKQHVQEFPRQTRWQHLAVPATSASPERLFNSVGLVKSDLRGSLLDTTLIDVMWAKQAP